MESDTAILAGWVGAAEAQKHVFNFPAWEVQTVGHMTKRKASTKGHKPFRSSDNERMVLLLQLSDARQISIESLRLRIETFTHRPVSDTVATLEALYRENYVCISRLDFWPSAPHTNVQYRRLGIPPTIDGSHFHPCRLNAGLGMSDFRGNLPAAVRLESEPQSFREALAIVEGSFVVGGLGSVGEPNWTGRLL